ncbi:MAG TPA: polyprenol monophosphomannose synthase, partial [Saprospiraceae bacterium]|nr:polyprenol monophosphomannose synthase [Saprospiraceae bacterium]
NDATAGFVGYNAGVLRNINLDSIEFVGYAFQIEMKYAAYVNEFKLKEIPITFKDREKGQSKMNLSIISEALGGVLKMRWKSFRNQYTKTDKA